MASKSTIMRFVRCPRCRKVLAEIASVPVYQCGECGATLRAKHYSSTNQNSNATAPEITVSASSGARSAGYLDPQLSKAADASSSFSNKGDEHAEDCLKERQMELEDRFFNARGWPEAAIDDLDLLAPALQELQQKPSPEAHGKMIRSLKILTGWITDIFTSCIISIHDHGSPSTNTSPSMKIYKNNCMNWSSKQQVMSSKPWSNTVHFTSLSSKNSENDEVPQEPTFMTTGTQLSSKSMINWKQCQTLPETQQSGPFLSDSSGHGGPRNNSSST